jgi:threonine dehydrogenase-like Zn-dependent dehydrogenase
MADWAQALVPTSARAFWTVRPGEGALKEEVLGAPKLGQALIRTLASGISRGTESLVFQGKVPDSQKEAMRCPHQQGEFPAPVKYGYCSVGRVEQGPEEWLGRRVFCLYPHQDWYCVDPQWLTPIPDSVPDERAVLAANMETALNGLWDATVRIGDRVSVVGAGVVGILAAALASRIAGTTVELVDIDPSRRALAQTLGCGFAPPSEARTDADVVIHASGRAQGLATALAVAAFEATVLELSWYGAEPVSVPLGEAFHSKRLTLRSSQVGAVATAQRARWSHRRRLVLALDLLADPVYDSLLTGFSRFEDLPKTLSRLSAQPDGELCHVVRYH